MTPDLVIFDCDGVLVDSEPLAMRVLLEAIAEAGAVIDAAQAYESFLGKSLASTTEILRRNHDIDIDTATLDGMRMRLYALFRQELRAIPGIVETLQQLDMPFCVASSSQVERIRLALDITKLTPFFGDNVFSASMVERGKPAPDLFLHAATQMQAVPARCIVVEDSPAGIAAATAAGMRVFAFTGGSHAQSEAHREALPALNPTLIFDDMARLPALIFSLCENEKVS